MTSYTGKTQPSDSDSDSYLRVVVVMVVKSRSEVAPAFYLLPFAFCLLPFSTNYKYYLDLLRGELARVCTALRAVKRESLDWGLESGHIKVIVLELVQP